MRINLLASETRGSNPTFGVEATVEADGNGSVYLSLPRTAGVISGDSAIALAQAILETVGFAPEGASAGVPAGWHLKNTDTGFVLCDEHGVVQRTFVPEARWVAE